MRSLGHYNKMKTEKVSNNDKSFLLRQPKHLCRCLGIIVLFASSSLNAATSQFAGGKLGSPLANGLNDIDGDGISDVSLADFGSFAAIDATGGYGLTGDSGGGAAWVRGSSTIAAPDRAGTDEAYFSPFRGNIMSSSDNWSKVRLSSGDGWVQWKFAAGSSPVIPLVFVREAPDENLSAAQARDIAYAISAGIARAHAIKFFGETGVKYALYSSDDLVTFSPTGASLTGTGSGTAFYVEALKPSEFYKVFRE